MLLTVFLIISLSGNALGLNTEYNHAETEFQLSNKRLLSPEIHNFHIVERSFVVSLFIQCTPEIRPHFIWSYQQRSNDRSKIENSI